MKNINYFNNLFSRVKEHSSPTVNRRSTDCQSQRQYSIGIWKYVAMMALLLTLACGNAWGATVTMNSSLGTSTTPLTTSPYIYNNTTAGVVIYHGRAIDNNWTKTGSPSTAQTDYKPVLYNEVNSASNSSAKGIYNTTSSNPYAAKTQSGKYYTITFTNCTQVKVAGTGGGFDSGKQLVFVIKEGSTVIDSTVVTSEKALSNPETATSSTLSASKTYTLKICGTGTYDCYALEVAFYYPTGGGCTSITPTWSTDYSSTTLNVGATSSTPVVGKGGSSGALSFSSSDATIASVDASTGVVTGVGAGTATITATVAASGDYCSGTVTKSFTIKAGVTYDANSATGGSVPTDDNTYAYNADIIVAGNTGGLYKTDKVFNGWNTRSDGTGTHYDAGATIQMPEKSTGLVLYAEWVGYATSWEWWNSGQSHESTTFTYLTNKNYICSFKSSASTAVASWDMSGGEYYRGIKIKTKDHYMYFWVQTGKRVSITFGTRPIKPTFTVGGVDKSSEVGASTNSDSITVTYTTTADTKFYIENETATNTAFTVKSVKIEDAASSCTGAWSFHSKNSSSEWRDPICMELDGDGDFYISEETAINVGDVSYKVGYQGVDEAKTAETDWQWMPMGPSRNWTVGAHPTASNAGGALGYFYIHSTYTDNNRYIGFFPSSYMLRQGSGESWSNTTFNPASSAYGETVWTTPVQKYTASNAADYMYTALGTGNGGAVGCAMSTAMRPIYLKLHSDWKANSPKFYIYYFKNGTDKNGWSGLMQAVSGTGGDDLVGWIPEGDWDRVQFVRFNPGDAVASWKGNVWNSTYAITLDSEKNYYVLEAQGNGGALDWYGHWDLYHNGFYRIWVDNASTNFALHYVPQYVLEYDNNGGSGSIDPQSVALDADPNTVTVKAVTGFTAPEGKHFVNWNTAPGGGGTSYDPSDSYSLTADATLYAQWAWDTYDVSASLTNVSVKSGTTGTGAATHGSAYTVTLQGATGYNLPASVTVTIGGSPATLTTDYTWNSSTGVLTVLAAKVTGNISITASGVAKTTAITLEAGEGGTDGSATATYGTSTITDYVAATRTGYTLGNYYQDDGDHNILTKEGELNSGDKGSILDDGLWVYDGAAITLYAQWSATSYTLSYDLAGGSVESPNPTSYTIESSDITLNNPTKTGYTFAGWTGTGLAEATTTVTIAAGSTGNRSYTATWTAIVPSSVSLNKSSTTITVGGTETLTATISPAVVADNTITWSTSDADVATVDGGVVTAVAAGTATITATTHNGKSASCEVTVAPAVTYTVTYDAQDGSVTPTSEEVSTATLPTPTKSGYTFQGWYTSGGTLISGTYNPTADITLHALWQQTECAGGGGGGDPVVIKLFDGSTDDDFAASPITVSGVSLIYTAYDKPAAASATDVSSKTNNVNSKNYAKGYQFSNTSIDNGNPRRCVQFTIPSGYTATFTHAFGGSGNNRIIMLGSSVITSTGDAGYIATLATTPGSGGSGGIWGGTYSTPLAAGTYYICGASGGWQVVELIFTLTPTGGGGSGTCYYVTYNGNGADGGFTTDEASHASGSNVTVKTNSFTKTGYTFTGWNTAANGSGDSKTAGGTFTITKDTVLYAQWEETASTYTLTASATVTNPMTADSKTGAITGSFTNNPVTDITSGTTTSTSSNTFTVNKGTPVTVTAAATIEGTEEQCDECTYVFDSWENIPAEVTADVSTIHAIYKTTYSISFKETDETDVEGISASSYDYGEGKDASTLPTPTKSGYTFDGWYDKTLTTPATDIDDDAWGNITYYAKWTADVTYTVTYKANGGTGDDVEDDAATTIASNSFTAPATMAFVGWNTKDDGSGKDYAAGDAVDDDLTLYAQWRYKVYYIASSASESNDVTTALASKYVVSKHTTTATSYNASDYSDYALVVLSESLDGSNAGTNDHELKVIVGLDKPILNLKTYFYGADGDATKRWKWGAPNGGKKPKCIYVKNSTYANLTSHPIYSGLTPDGSDSIQILKAPLTTKPIQPIGGFASGCEGYTLALVPNKSSGSGTAIHEMTATQRSNATGKTITSKYLMISIQSGELSNLSDNGKKLIKNAADYLITGSQWVPQYKITHSEASNGSYTIKVGDASAVSTNTTSAAGTTITLAATPSSGYELDSWTVTGDVSSGSVTVTSNTFTMPAEAVTVAATFVEGCTKPGTPTRPTIEDGTLTHAGATFVWDPAGATANSDGYVVSIVKVSDGSTVLDWTSSGIYTEGEAGGLYDATGLTGSTEYYFIVKAIGDDGYCSYGDTSRLTFTTLGTPYTITYHLNGASWINEGAATYRHGTGYTLPVAGDMSNTGYTFGGWFADDDLSTGGVVTEIGTSESGAKEFWAKWTENTYTVTYSANGGTGDAMSNTVGHYVTLSANTYTKSGYVFAGWNTATDGSGESYSEGEEIELTANMTLHAIWATDYTITWDASPKLSGVDAKPNLGGGNYTITASVATWTGSLTTSMISAETSGVTITRVLVDNSVSPKTITATFNVGASVAGESVTFELDVPAAGVYSAKSSTKNITIDRCTGSSSGSDGVLFSAEFKDSGLGTSDICTAANTAYTFTTDQLKAAPTGGSIKAYTTDNLTHLKYVDNGVYLKGTDAVIQIDLDNAIATNDLFEYVNVHSSNPNAYLRHTSPTTTTDQIVLTGYGSKNVKVMLPAAFNDKTTLYIVKNSTDFKLHKAAIIRPAFLMLLDDSKSAADLSGTDVEMTTSTDLTFIKGGRVYYTSPSSGDLKIKESGSKKYIQFNKSAGYIKVVLSEALAEGDVIGFDSYNTNELAFTSTSTRSTSIRSSGQLYTVDASSDLKGKSTFYIWQNSGSSDFLRGLQIARSGVAGGGGGTDKITTTLTWNDDALDIANDGVAKVTGDADFTFTASQDTNSLGAITYSSNNTSVATVNASGKVHIVGAGNATITATMAASGCYKEATVSYNITVTDNCADVAGTISTEDLGCSGVKLTVTGHTTSGKTVSYQWYKNGGAIGGATSDNYTANTAGEYYVVVTNTGDGHCAMASTNTITLEDSEAATASNIVNSWYVKNGRRTPDIALVQTENATDFTVTSGGSPITTFAGCAFYLGTDGIIYLRGQQEDGSAPNDLTSGDETLKFTATACGGNSSELSIIIHKQDSTDRPSVAFVVDGTKDGAFDAEDENHSVNTELYQYLDYGADETGAFDLTGQNVYSTVDEQAIREHYSQFDAILITDDPSTDTKSGKKSYVDAFGTMIDVRPILTMEAFVSKWGNWKAKGIDGNPESPNPRQYKMKLQCKDHAIFKDLSVGTNVETETIDGVEYWTVTMVDNTKSPYSGVADGTDTDTKPALQGFSADDVNSLLLLGQISGGSLYAGVERQEETAARLMLLGLNAKALPNALTPEGKKVIENALKYLIETDLEKVDDCSNYFTGATDEDWNKDSNWSKNHVPNSPNVRVRILSKCVINSGTYKVAEVDIATSGKSLHKDGEMTGKLTINAGAALIVGGKIRTAEAPYFNTGDLKPTTEEDLVINTSSTAQAALIFNNDAGDTKATVNLYSRGRNISSTYQFQYFAVPMSYIDVNPAFAGSGIYTYVWHEASGWERRGYYVGLEAFEGVGITTKFADARSYQMKGTLASTATKEITLTHENEGHNLIGNSWTAPIQISQLEEDNSSMSNKTVYIYNTGNDDTADDGYGTGAGQWTAIPFNAAGFDAWDGLKVIPAMQAFEIVPDEEETLTLDYDKVVRGDNQTLTEPLRAPKASHEGIELMRIRVADSNAHADLYLFEGSTFSDEFDNGWEAAFMDGDGPSAQLYADVALGRMAVVATDELEGTFLGFVPGQETTYTFSFGGAGMGYYLNDLKLMTSTLINEEATYSFTFEEGDANRFYISRTPIEAPQTPTGVDNTHSGEVKAQKFIYNDKMYIMINGRVYSAEGQIVK